MAAKKKSSKKEIDVEITLDDVAADYSGVYNIDKSKLRDKVYYPCGFRNIDVLIGTNIYDSDDKLIRANRGFGSGTWNTVAGPSGIGKTTFAIQMGANITKPLIDLGAKLFVLDVEGGFTVDRIKAIANYSDNETRCITIVEDTPYIESVGELINSIIEFKKKYNLKYKAKNAYNQDIEIYVPTVFVIDSLTQMPSQTVYEEEKQNPTDALHQAGAIDKLFKLYRRKMIEYNIIVFSICAITEEINMANPMARPKKRWKGLPATVKILGGRKNAYNSDIGILMDSYEEATKDKLDTKVSFLDSNYSINCILFKSRQGLDALEFNLIASLQNEFNALASFIYECQNLKIIESAGSVKKIQGLDTNIRTQDLITKFKEDPEVRKALYKAYDEYRRNTLDSTRKTKEQREQISKEQDLMMEGFE